MEILPLKDNNAMFGLIMWIKEENNICNLQNNTLILHFIKKKTHSNDAIEYNVKNSKMFAIFLI